MRLIQEFDKVCEAENENVLTLCAVGDLIGEIEQSEQTNDLILSKRKRTKAMLTNRDKLCSKVKANKNESTESQSTASTETHQAGSSEIQPTGCNESHHGIYINDKTSRSDSKHERGTTAIC